MQLVLIEWYDSHYIPGWHREPPMQKPLVCKSVGWLLYESKEAMTIASHITQEDDPQRSGEMTIPRGAIVKVTKL